MRGWFMDTSMGIVTNEAKARRAFVRNEVKATWLSKDRSDFADGSSSALRIQDVLSRGSVATPPRACRWPCWEVNCPTPLTGKIEGQRWQDACAASLLPAVTITCSVWGP